MKRLVRTTVSPRKPVRKNAAILVASFLAFVLAGCTLGYTAFEGDTYSKLHADFVPVNSLRLVQVRVLGTRDGLVNARKLDQDDTTLYQELIALGIPDEDIRDGSVGNGEVMCCGGPPSEQYLIYFYVPPNIDVGVGDIVEVRAGELPGRPDAYPNVVTQVRQQRGTAAGCRWLPESPGLWLRVLYCSGIENEGWIQREGIIEIWYRPPPS